MTETRTSNDRIVCPVEELESTAPHTTPRAPVPGYRLKLPSLGVPRKDLEAVRAWRRAAEAEADGLGLGGAAAGQRHFAACCALLEVFAAGARLAATGTLSPAEAAACWDRIAAANSRALSAMAPLRPRQAKAVADTAEPAKPIHVELTAVTHEDLARERAATAQAEAQAEAQAAGQQMSHLAAPDGVHATPGAVDAIQLSPQKENDR